MTQADFSSTAHRLDNLAHHLFVQAYAKVRYHVIEQAEQDLLGAFLRGYMDSLEKDIAEKLCVPQTTLVGKLIDLGMELCDPTTAKDEAE